MPGLKVNPQRILGLGVARLGPGAQIRKRPVVLRIDRCADCGESSRNHNRDRGKPCVARHRRWPITPAWGIAALC